jgi:hypothetical protein
MLAHHLVQYSSYIKYRAPKNFFGRMCGGQEKPLDDVSVLSKYSCNINVATQQAVDTIKEVYELDSNERCIELVIDHYYELVLALIDGSTLITSTLDGKRRREVMLTHHPHSVDRT